MIDMGDMQIEDHRMRYAAAEDGIKTLRIEDTGSLMLKEFMNDIKCLPFGEDFDLMTEAESLTATTCKANLHNTTDVQEEDGIKTLQIEDSCSSILREFMDDIKCLPFGGDFDLMTETATTCKDNTIVVPDVYEEEDDDRLKKQKAFLVAAANAPSQEECKKKKRRRKTSSKEPSKESILCAKNLLENFYGKEFYLEQAKDKLLAGNVAGARMTLLKASANIPQSEEIWLAWFDLEFKDPVRDPYTAAAVLELACKNGCRTSKIWMKSAIVQRELGDTDLEFELLYKGLKHDPSFFKLRLMLGQLWERLGFFAKAKSVYESGLKHCRKNSTPFWLSLSNLEERTNGLSKAGEVLDLSLRKNLRNPKLWLAKIVVESRLGNKKLADSIMNTALQLCPKSGILWAASVEMVPQPQRKSKAIDALKKCKEDPHVFAAIAKMFWYDRDVDKARKWLDNAVTISPDIGDFWALYYKFELDLGTDESKNNVLNRCVAAEPKHGEKWQVVSKAVKNSHMHTQDILKQVVLAL